MAFNAQEFSDNFIESTVTDALKDAILHMRNMGIEINDNSWNTVSIPAVKDNYPESLEDEEHDDSVAVTVNEDNDDQETFNFLSVKTKNDLNDLDDPKSNIFANLCTISAKGMGEELLLKDFSWKLLETDNDDLSEAAAFVRVIIGNKSAFIK